ncbi:MAG: hypothetical protein ACRC2H_04890, partial [Silanimonas sp.]
MSPPRLRLALPQYDGSLMLDFGADGRRRLDAETLATFGIASDTLFVDADTMTPEGLRTRCGDRAPAALLHAAAVPAGEMHERRNGLCLANVRTQIGSAPRELYVVLYPFERGKALRIDDVIGAGMAADGYTPEVALDAVPGDVAATSLLQDADAHWVLEV